ncbi:hybrid sensor histidine kinase/response regulator [Candidatus Parabeggiatoa sp. HSG14]|uniref:hybrid sensor histidine kinase/response regulator n=1 Tax=Candidatus Parabeggiatoa sp. HSG14 TaxID=3055593 RepID=UPI0025A7EA63|nr:hybrid sensor histidine kinase/response regulator [Thiotrichales bacterium HSG14]
MPDKKQNKGMLLIVDDTPANVSVLYDFLTENGFKVLVTQEGKRAIQKAQYAKPDLILLDVMMPGIDGFETCRILKSDEETKDIPVIFMTALADTVDKVKGFQLGAVDYITKPFQHEEVLARVTAQLNSSSLKKQLEARTAELEERNMELDAFARTVAHDLKNPLNAVIGYTEMLAEECTTDTLPSEETIETLQDVVQASHKMLNIIEALLLLSGITKQNSLETQRLEMSDIITQVMQRLSYMIKESQAEVKLPESWPKALGYAPWIEEIWTNYISNGIKYGGKPPFLELGADENKGMIRFWIQDNGPGLSKEAQAKLFTPFTRLHTDTAEGHGLGLSIVQQIVKKLGGKIGVETTEGKGCRFYFTLPI